jgi:hypothetical protein
VGTEKILLHSSPLPLQCYIIFKNINSTLGTNSPELIIYIFMQIVKQGPECQSSDMHPRPLKICIFLHTFFAISKYACNFQLFSVPSGTILHKRKKTLFFGIHLLYKSEILVKHKLNAYSNSLVGGILKSKY